MLDILVGGLHAVVELDAVEDVERIRHRIETLRRFFIGRMIIFVMSWLIVDILRTGRAQS